MYGVMFACIHAIQTSHAPAVINCMVFRVNTCRFALAGTERAGVAFSYINDWTEQGILCHKSQSSPNMTDGIAICPPIPLSQKNQNNKSGSSNQENRKTLYPYLFLIKSVIVHAFRHISQGVIAQVIERSKQVLSNPSISAVRSKQGGN